MENKFDLTRFWLLIKNDIIVHKKTMLLYFANCTLICVLVHFLGNSSLAYYTGSYSVNYSIIIFILIIAVSFSFYELDFHDKQLAYHLLPASKLEKYLARFVITIIIFFLISVVMIYLTFLSRLLFFKKELIPLLVPNQGGNIITFFISYLFFHSIFFFGALFFKKNEFFKTVFVVSLYVIVVIYLNPFQMKIHIAKILGYYTDHLISMSANRTSNESMVITVCNEIIRALTLYMKYLLPLFLWVLGYFRLKEEEVSDGVR